MSNGAILAGEVAVPFYLKSAIAGINSRPEGYLCVVCTVFFCVEEWVLRNVRL